MSPGKRELARCFAALGLSRAGLAAQRALLWPFVRAINYHDVPPQQEDAFDRQLDFYAEHFECVDERGLLAFHRGEWKSDRPGLLLSFDDGLRSHAEVVAPRLEARGWVGWFMVPVGFVDAAPADQVAFAGKHRIGHAAFDYGDPRIACTWDQVRGLAERHVVGCHGLMHRRLAADLSSDELQREIPHARARLEAELGRDVAAFAWIGGEEESYSRDAAMAIADAGFRIGFMTNNHPIRPGCDLLQLQRTNIESHDPPAVVAFQLSGAMDVLYWGKRRRVNRLTRTG